MTTLSGHDATRIAGKAIPRQPRTLSDLNEARGTTSDLAQPPHRPRVVWIDDDEDVLCYAVKYLTRVGFDVVVARSGRDGLRLLRALVADVVVLDLRLGDMHGRDWLRERARLRIATPVVIVTGFSDDFSPDEARRLGAIGFYEKPLRGDDLTVILATAAAPRAAVEPPPRVTRLLRLVGRLQVAGLRSADRDAPADVTRARRQLLAELLAVLLEPNIDLRLVSACTRATKRVTLVGTEDFFGALPAVEREITDAAVSMPSQDSKITAVLAYLETAGRHPGRTSGRAIAQMLGLSRTAASRYLLKCTGHHLPELRRSAVIRAALIPLIASKQPLNDIAIDCGFLDPSRFTHLVKRVFGMTPESLRALAHDALDSNRGEPC
jgi:FixJ family two-component response regulator/AraC-like DNA-binding protein